MKLGEALNQRKYLAGLIPQITKKLTAAVLVVQGATINPADDLAMDLRYKLDSVLNEHAELVLAINRTNNVTALKDFTEDNFTIMEAIGLRDQFKVAIAQYQAVFAAIKPRTERSPYTTDATPTVFVVADGIDAVEIKARLNQMSADYRKLDTALQASNWTVDLVS